MDGGDEAIGDAEELAAVRRQARTVWIQSLTVTAVLTAIAVAI